MVVAQTAAEVTDALSGQVISGEFGLRQVQAFFADDRINTVEISQGADIADLDLTWFGPTEIAQFWDFLSD